MEFENSKSEAQHAIFGLGSAARMVQRYLKHIGQEVTCFVVSEATTETAFASKPVVELSRFAKNLKIPTTLHVTTINHRISQKIADQLADVPLIEVNWVVPEALSDHIGRTRPSAMGVADRDELLHMVIEHGLHHIPSVQLPTTCMQLDASLIANEEQIAELGLTKGPISPHHLAANFDMMENAEACIAQIVETLASKVTAVFHVTLTAPSYLLSDLLACIRLIREIPNLIFIDLRITAADGFSHIYESLVNKRFPDEGVTLISVSEANESPNYLTRDNSFESASIEMPLFEVGKHPVDKTLEKATALVCKQSNDLGDIVFVSAEKPSESVKNKTITRLTIEELESAFIKDTTLYIIGDMSDCAAVIAMEKIIAGGGRFMSIQSDHKRPYRFTDKHVLSALKSTWRRSSEVSHLNISIHENICEAINITKNISGHYVEYGVFMGGSALTAVNMLDALGLRRQCWFLDTYDGFISEEESESVDLAWDGELKLFGRAETMKHVTSVLSNAKTPYFVLENNVLENELPAAIDQIAVANIDVDQYEPTLKALERVGSKIAVGGIIICEDATSTPGLNGAYLAMDQFMKSPIGAQFVKFHKVSQYFLFRVSG